MTSPFRRDSLERRCRTRPFSAFTAWKDDNCNAGYILTNRSVPIIAVPIYSHIALSCKENANDLLAILLYPGVETLTRIKANSVEMRKIRKVSTTNCRK